MEPDTAAFISLYRIGNGAHYGNDNRAATTVSVRNYLPFSNVQVPTIYNVHHTVRIGFSDDDKSVASKTRLVG
jgi:hypothetical protein